MQSHLGKVWIVLQRCAGRSGVPRSGVYLSSSLTCQQSALLGPVQRQIEFGQPRRGELDGLPPLQDRLDQLRAQEGEANQTANVAPGNTVTLGQFLERSGSAGGPSKDVMWERINFHFQSLWHMSLAVAQPSRSPRARCRPGFPIEVGLGGGRLLVYASRPPTEPQEIN